MNDKLLPCPFCGSYKIDPKGWAGNDGTSGPVCDDCMASARDIQAWNRRADTAFITFRGGSVSEASGFHAIPKGLTQTPLTTSELAAALDQTPPAEDPLRAALRQCATELEEASKLLRQHYPGVAEMLRIAADRAAKVAEGVREPQSVGEIIRRDQLRSIIVPAIRANMESRDTTRLTNDLIDAFIKAEMEQRQ